MAESKVTEIDFSVLQFYDAVWALLSDAGQYAQCVKLKDNLLDPDTRHKVVHVFERYYDGDMGRLNDQIYKRQKQCAKRIYEINRLCRREGLMEVKDVDALIDLLLNSDRREAWKKLIRKHEKANRIIALQTIELLYRKANSDKAP